MKKDFSPKTPTARTPSGVLKLYCTPLTPSYSDSMIFKTAAARESWHNEQYAATTSAVTFNNMRPFRAGQEIVVNGDYEKIQKNNYFAYSGDTIIWYGFIEGVTYVSENACKISYSIDVIQTFMFDAIINENGKSKIPECFVERETVGSDNYFEHIVEEGIGAQTQQIKQRINLYAQFNSASAQTSFYLIISKAKLWETIPEGDFKPSYYSFESYGYNYCAMFYSILPTNLIDYGLSVLFENSKFDGNNILGVFPIPSGFVEGTLKENNLHLISPTTTKTLKITIPQITEYTPKNNKIYTQEFCKIKILNTQSGDKELNTNKLLHGTQSLSDTLYVYLNAMNNGGFIIANNPISSWAAPTSTLADTGILIFSNALPSINIISDSYAEWERARGNTLALSLTASAIGTGISAVSALAMPSPQTAIGAINSGISTASSVVSAKIEQNQALIKADNIIASSSSITDIYNCSVPILIFTAPQIDEVKKIDSYFNTYGYKVNEIKAPALFNRQKWDFIKTTNCRAVGTCSHLYLDKINQIFNNGIRLHHNTFNTTTDYTITNAIA